MCLNTIVINSHFLVSHIYIVIYKYNDFYIKGFIYTNPRMNELKLLQENVLQTKILYLLHFLFLSDFIFQNKKCEGLALIYNRLSIRIIIC